MNYLTSQNRLIVLLGITQGILLVLLRHLSAQGLLTMNGEGMLPLYTVVIAVPIVLELALSDWKGRRPWILAAGLSFITLLLGFYTEKEIGFGDIRFLFICTYSVTIFIGLFCALPFIQIWLKTQNYHFDYPELFRRSWNNAIALVSGKINVIVVYLLLLFTSGLFELIGLEFLASFFSNKDVILLTSATIFALAITLIRHNDKTVAPFRVNCLNIFRLLSPFLSAVSLLFLFGIALKGMDEVFKIEHFTLLVLMLQALTILFLNAVYDDGASVKPLRSWIRKLLNLAILTLPIYSIMAIYGLNLRINQYGWSVNRVWAALIIMILALFACGYAIAVLVPRGKWMNLIEPINKWMALVLIIVCVSVNSPLFDPKSISLKSQMSLLVDGKQDSSRFDYEYLGRSLGRDGTMALIQVCDLSRSELGEESRNRAIAVLDNLSCSEKRDIEAYELPPVTKRQAREVYVLPIGEFPKEVAMELLAYFREKMDLNIKILPQFSIEDGVRNHKRGQLIVEDLIEGMKRHHPGISNNPEKILIGLTLKDIYPRTTSWGYAFGFHMDNQFAVISTARMDSVFWNKPPNEDLLDIRLRKMTTRYIGILYYGYPKINAGKSVLCAPIGGLDDLDSIGEDFLSTQVPPGNI